MKKFLSHFTKSRKIAEIGKMKYWNSENTTQIKSDIREMTNLRALHFLFKNFKKNTKVSLINNIFYYQVPLAGIFASYFIFSVLCVLVNDDFIQKIALITLNVLYILLLMPTMIDGYYGESKRKVMQYVDDIVYKKHLVEAFQKSAMHFEKETLIEVIDTHKNKNTPEPSLKRKRL